MSNAENSVPHVTFYFNASQGSYNAQGKFVVAATFRTAFNSEADWEPIRSKLQDEGVKIYTVEDFKSAIAEALRSENSRLEKEIDTLRFEKDRLARENESLQKDLNQYTTLHRNFQKAMSG